MKNLLVCVLCLLPLGLSAQDKILEVYSSPSCGCCELWVAYMKQKGYNVTLHKDDTFMNIKEEKNIKPEYQSCHTGIIEGYVIEGHIPEDAVSWLLANKPKDVIGITAPGMPQGSPGMEQGYEEEYPVLIMLKNGGYKVYGYYLGDKKIH